MLQQMLIARLIVTSFHSCRHRQNRFTFMCALQMVYDRSRKHVCERLDILFQSKFKALIYTNIQVKLVEDY